MKLTFTNFNVSVDWHSHSLRWRQGQRGIGYILILVQLVEGVHERVVSRVHTGVNPASLVANIL